MKNLQVDIRQIEKFADVYHITSDCRGYRWSRGDATALLDKLREFRTARERDGSRPFCYSLQPMVFQRFKDGSLRVVDGQQRLTTIAIVCYVLDGEQINFGWNLFYDELNTDLHQLLANLDADMSINGHFMREVRDAVREWRSDPMNAPANERLDEDVRSLFVSDEAQVRCAQSVVFTSRIFDQADFKDSSREIPAAYGKRWASWERLKSVMDGGLTKKIESRLGLRTSWRHLMDNDWSRRLWERCGHDIDRMNAVFEGVVRMAWRVASEEGVDFDMLRLGDWLTENAEGDVVLFYREVSYYMNCLSAIRI